VRRQFKTTSRSTTSTLILDRWLDSKTVALFERGYIQPDAFASTFKFGVFSSIHPNSQSFSRGGFATFISMRGLQETKSALLGVGITIEKDWSQKSNQLR
jgi:hypothetical protein